MKKLTSIITFIAVGFLSYSQPDDFFDRYKEVELISFESNSDYLVQGTPTTNIWQIGEPQKLTFNQAYSGNKVIATDTLNAYPASNQSWFDLVLPMVDFIDFYESVYISFYQKLNTDTLRDGGYFTVSYDMGKTWQNIINDTMDWFEGTPKNWFWYEDNMYTNADTLFNGEYGFSGSITEWQQVMFEWVTLRVKKSRVSYEDTMIVRFNFISDATENARDGWMIDDIRLLSIDYGGNVHEMPLQSNLEVFPNPVIQTATLRSKNHQMIKQVRIFNTSGQLIDELNPESETCFFDKKHLVKGMYLVKCTFSDNKSETIRMTIN